MGLTGHGTIVDVILIIAILIIVVVVIKWLIVPLIYGDTELGFIVEAAKNNLQELRPLSS